MLQDAETTKEPIAGKLTEDDVRRIVREEVERAFTRDPAARRASIIASKGTLDWAYPPLILATTAAAVKVDPVGNPAMPMPIPIPDIVSSLPGMVPLASRMMRSRFAIHNVATIGELLDAARDIGVRLIACRMTMEVFGYREADFIDGVEFGGAAAFMSQARRSHVTMFI